MITRTSAQLDPAALTVAAAVACTSLVQYLAARATESELSSEAVCWMIFPFLFRPQAKPSTYVSPLGDVTSTKKPTGSLHLWGPAACISALSLCKTEFGAVVCLFVSPPGRYLSPAICSHHIFNSHLQHRYCSRLKNISNYGLALRGMRLLQKEPYLTRSLIRSGGHFWLRRLPCTPCQHGTSRQLL